MSKLTYSNIIREAVNAVADSEAVKQWCLDTYGLLPSVRGDMNSLDPPAESDCPLITFSPVGGEVGQDRGTFLRAFIVRVAVSDTETETTIDNATGRILKLLYKGTDRVSHLLENLVYPALCERFNSFNCPISTSDEEIEAMESSLFQAKAGMTIHFDTTIGEERPFI